MNWQRPETTLLVCPTCGEPATSVTETVEPKTLCGARSSKFRYPGSRSRRYEPCNHEVPA